MTLADTALSAGPIYAAAGTVGIGLLSWIGRTVWKRLDDIQAQQTRDTNDLKASQEKQTRTLDRLDVALRGYNGDNGLLGDVRDLKVRVARLESEDAA